MKQETRKLLDKADRALQAARTLQNSGFPEFAAGRAYYAMLHAVQAALREKGLKYSKHSGVHSAFGQHFVNKGIVDTKFHRWLLDAFDERLIGDYDINANLDQESVSKRIFQAGEMIETIRSIILKVGNQ